MDEESRLSDKGGPQPRDVGGHMRPISWTEVGETFEAASSEPTVQAVARMPGGREDEWT